MVTDHAGTPRELCSEQGDIIWRGQHEIWGGYKQQHQQGLLKKYASDAANDPIECDLRYQGQIYDRETGLYYNRHRYYDTDSGQYLSSDPIGFAGGLRPQAYVHNPMDWVDPFGLSRYPGVDFTGSDALYPVSNGQKNIVKIKMEGSRGLDFKAANEAAGFKSQAGNFTQRSHPSNYTWHHLDDYDPVTNTTTMQLVETSAHEATFPHSGSVSQFEGHHGVKYGSSEAKQITKSYDNKPPKCLK
ncbi:RHS repeat-associated core domain-containing protein [Vibrio penaeicida]|uniref:RHS repeat-associated core domain-containing protein n=1 Tax=Vibrio penaeicida TaxID=104609 RepID=UPI0027336511|nr:RHS repeat-associated core domain-containing protein [Vibrio penaeicida]MDP2571923.1 RHS repeat-associated core domain-containing protein [Vibrio penaeicida]